MEKDQPLTPQEVADNLRIAKNTVYELIKRGELRGYRVGNKFRVNAGDLEAYRARSEGRLPAGSVPAAVPAEPGLSLPGDRAVFQGPAGMPEPSGAPSALPPGFPGYILCGQDTLLDLLAWRLESHPEGCRVLRSYMGSYNGLHALYQGQVHAATAHLWDGRTGTYNLPFLPHILPGMAVTVVHLATRPVGFYVPRGNPAGLSSWDDLGRPGLVMANRERGSGIRVLTDQKLLAAGRDGTQIPGYQKSFPTHLAAALAVARGGADYALGTARAVTQAGNLDFIPLQEERYELVLPRSANDSRMVSVLREILVSADFRQELEGLGGYGLAELGKVVQP